MPGMEEVIHRNIQEDAIKMNKSAYLFVEGFVSVDFSFGGGTGDQSPVSFKKMSGFNL
jgi:hypothetical protein